MQRGNRLNIEPRRADYIVNRRQCLAAREAALGDDHTRAQGDTSGQTCSASGRNEMGLYVYMARESRVGQVVTAIVQVAGPEWFALVVNSQWPATRHVPLA